MIQQIHVQDSLAWTTYILHMMSQNNVKNHNNYSSRQLNLFLKMKCIKNHQVNMKEKTCLTSHDITKNKVVTLEQLEERQSLAGRYQLLPNA